MAKIIDINNHRHDTEPPTPWLTDERVLKIQNPATRFTVAYLLDDLQVDPATLRIGRPGPAVHSLDRTLIDNFSGRNPRVDFIDDVKHHMQRILGKHPTSVALTRPKMDGIVTITYTL